MADLLIWYVIVTALGWLSFPIIFRLLPGLADKGFSFSKIFGLLAWGYLYWILGRLGITANNLAGLLFTLILVSLLSVIALRDKSNLNLKSWIKEHVGLILVAEFLFLVAFFAWAFVRAYNPEILGTEKPMELAFINAILGSETFPPHDPWMSGFAISYYYFGYILVAMIAKLAGTQGSVAFNLGVSLIFALSATGSFGLLFNLLVLSGRKWRSQLAPGLLGPFFILIVSNWEGFLHYIHSKGVFWRMTDSGLSSPFWSWLDIQNLVDPPAGDSFGHWWWWRASRVIQDYDFSGFGKEVISEFPFFSYLLADLHPHVLSMPFVFLILGFALGFYLQPSRETFKWMKLVPLNLSQGMFLLLAWMAGGMAFLNTWNFPMYVGILSGVYALRNHRDRSYWQAGDVIRDFLYLGATLGISGGILYLPWYVGFASQAGGIIPNVLYITRGSQFWVMFGPLLLPIFVWLFWLWGQRKQDRNLKTGLSITGILVLGLLILMLLVVGGISWLPLAGEGQTLTDLFLASIGGPTLSQALTEGLLRRVRWSGTLITLVVLSVMTFGLLFRKGSNKDQKNLQDADLFALVLIAGGLALTLFPEFIFLRDLFGYRINTIFKFYYQAWLMWGIAAAYGTLSVFRSINSNWRYPIFILLVLSVAMAMFYPVLSIQSKTNQFSRASGASLDGAAIFPASDGEGAAWLADASFGVIAEAVGGSYSSSHARMATYSGKPNVLGWDFHEIQWRGDSALVMPRKEAVANLYCTHNWTIARNIIDQYNISYIVVGDVEYSTYAEGSDYCPTGLNQEKFNLHLQTAFQNESLTIYLVPEDWD